MKERLAKVLAHAGIASRRAAERMIEEGRVSVNGEMILNIPTLVDASKDKIEVDGRKLKFEDECYVAFHKPRGVECTLKPSKKTKTIPDYLPEKLGRIYPVGRLDKESTGLLLMTNNGELANLLIHPRYKVKKIYQVDVKGPFNPRDLQRLQKGIQLEEGKTLPCHVELQHSDPKSSSLRFELQEGKKRQIRRMLTATGYDVRRLKRVKVGPISLGRLKTGEWRFLRPDEIKELKSFVKQK